jgi:predicted GIY-YIG superfamily endonuclease
MIKLTTESRFAGEEINFFFTLYNKPWAVIHKEYYGTRSEAFKREKHLKSLKSRKSLEKLF